MKSGSFASKDSDVYLTTAISQRHRWESRVAVIACRVRGRFSVARLLSRSVRFYLALSRGSPPPPPTGHQHPLCLSLFYSPLIHPSCRLSRRVGRCAYFGPSMLSPLRLPPFSIYFYFFSLLSIALAPFLALLLPDLIFHPHARVLRVAPTPSTHPSYSVLRSLSRAREPSPTDHS